MQFDERDFDKLIDTEINVEVILGTSEISIKEFLNLMEGDIIKLNKKIEDGPDIFVNDRIIGHGETLVVNEKLSVRLDNIVDCDQVVQYFFEES